MSRIRGINTQPEIKLRKELWRNGFRYIINDNRLPGKPDIVLPKYRTVIFVHGCVWHGHEGCPKYVIPKSHVDYWTLKIARNRQRDQEVWRQLEAKEWSVIVVWECQLNNRNFQSTVETVLNGIVKNGEDYRLSIETRKCSREEYYLKQRLSKERECKLLSEVKELFIVHRK